MTFLPKIKICKLYFCIVSVYIIFGATLPIWPYGSVGRSGAEFLSIPNSARSTALGDAFVVGSDDIAVLSYNPSMLGLFQYPLLTIYHNELLLDTRYENIGCVYPVWKGFAGFSQSAFWVPKFDRIDEQGNVTGKTGVYDSATAFSYGLAFNKLSIGSTIRYIYEKIDSTVVQGISFDFGICKQLYMYTPFPTDTNNFSVGIAFSNIGYLSSGDPLPRLIKAGLAYEFSKWTKLYIDLSESAISSSDLYDFTYGFDESFRINTGLELSWNDMIFFRGGYRFNDAGKYTAGIGCQYAISNVSFAVDTSYQDSGIFGPVYGISFTVKLIPKIITAEDRKMAEKYYQEGIRYYVGDDLDVSGYRI